MAAADSNPAKTATGFYAKDLLSEHLIFPGEQIESSNLNDFMRNLYLLVYVTFTATILTELWNPSTISQIKLSGNEMIASFSVASNKI